MREIQFRAKRKDNGEWVYGHYIGYSEYWGYAMFVRRESDGSVGCEGCSGLVEEFIEVIPETVGHNTNFKDDDKHTIWTGDICKFGAQFNSINIVKFLPKSGGYKIKDKWGDWWWLHDITASTNMLVIGNIHDNPELLKQ